MATQPTSQTRMLEQARADHRRVAVAVSILALVISVLGSQSLVASLGPPHSSSPQITSSR
jgi:hypothetical protein